MSVEELKDFDFKVVKASEYFGHKWLKGGMIRCESGYLAWTGKVIKLSLKDCEAWIRLIKQGEFPNIHRLSLVDTPELRNLYKC